MFRLIFSLMVISQNLKFLHTIRPEENGKFLNDNIEEDYLSRRRRPSSGASSGCNFNGGKGGRYKTDGTGRTFFDLAFLNVGYNYQYNINCGEPGGGSGVHLSGAGLSGHKPGLGHHKPGLGGHKPSLGGHKPGLGGHKPALGGHKPGSGDGDDSSHDFLSNRPLLSMILANRPLQGLFSQTSSQSAGFLGDVVSSVSGLLPTPQQFGQGLGDGISSFVQTLPQIGQSFQSLLPDFGGFQFPSFPSFTPGGQGGVVPPRPVVDRPAPVPTPTLPPATTTVFPNPDVGPDPVDPDDIIYSDETKPVHESHDIVTDPYNNRLRPGYGNRQYYYKLLRQNAQLRMNYQRNGNYIQKRLGTRYDFQPVQNYAQHRYNYNPDSLAEQRNYDSHPPHDSYIYHENKFDPKNYKETRGRQSRPFIFPS